MSTKSTTIARAAATAAKQSGRASRLARAQAEAARAEKAAREAAKAAEAARAAASTADPTAASKAARSAYGAMQAARSAELVAKAMASSRRRAIEGDEAVAKAVGASARYLVVRDGRLVASFLYEDDALLFEAELADLDRDHGIESAQCEVRTWDGKRVAGYLVTAGKMIAYQEDRQRRRHLVGLGHSGR